MPGIRRCRAEVLPKSILGHRKISKGERQAHGFLQSFIHILQIVTWPDLFHCGVAVQVKTLLRNRAFIRIVTEDWIGSRFNRHFSLMMTHIITNTVLWLTRGIQFE